MQFSISVTGIDETIKNLQNVARGLADHRDFLRIEVFPELKRIFREVFSTRGFGDWPPLAASTLAERRRRGFGTRPLIRTGDYLRNSTGLHGLRLRRNILEIVSPVKYARYHEYGTRRIPERPVFKLVVNRIRPELPKLYRKFRRRQRR